MKVVTSQGTTLNVSATKTKIWRLVDIWIYGLYRSIQEFIQHLDSPNNELVYRHCRCGLICKDGDHLNRIWLHDKGYISPYSVKNILEYSTFAIAENGILWKTKEKTQLELVWFGGILKSCLSQKKNYLVKLYQKL